jgi:3-hydroxyacyl-CoA dehydrogenase/enoyl-CoA hydratase/3-hydroxybutyryl-CoA epimerase/3-hydroxyacyl-CoA dehydrogenase/enoyl-CoA hydratase/3-hydroxybutyryl-CoA epimerase/enoyl-CoA isomerase
MNSDPSGMLTIHEQGHVVLQLDCSPDGSTGSAQPQLQAIDRALRLLAHQAPRTNLVLMLNFAKSAAGASSDQDQPAAVSPQASDWPVDQQAAAAIQQRLANCPAVTVAAWTGCCTGWLAEMVIHCQHRLAVAGQSETIRFAHTTCGVIPAESTLQRLLQLTGLEHTALLICGAQSLSADSAGQLCLIDRLVPSEAELLSAAVQQRQRPVGEGSPLPTRSDTSESSPTRRNTNGGALAARVERLLWDVAHPAPQIAQAALRRVHDVRADGVGVHSGRGVAAGRPHPPQPADGPERAALRHVELLARQAVRLSSRAASDRGPVPRVGICGAGIMGQGMAVAHMRCGVPVHLYDANRQTLDQAVHSIRQRGEREMRDSWYRVLFPRCAAQLVHQCGGELELAECDLVVESVVENRELKQQILGRLEAAAGPATILASNTSTVSITQLAAQLTRPERCCGLHFCNPADQRRLVEVIRGQQTSDSTIQTAIGHVLRIGKLPVVVADRPGFLVNRLLVMYLNEALQMLCEGLAAEQIDCSARQFGMPLGPFELLDMIGTDTAMMAGRTVWEAYPDRVVLNPVLPALVKRNRLGWKTQRGFYRYETVPGPARPDSDLANLLAPYIRPRDSSSHQQVVYRLLLPMLLEATRMLDERVVGSPQEIDTATVFGLAFPAHRGGLLYWADQSGAARIVQLLDQWEHLGTRLQPTERLRQMAASGQSFHQLGQAKQGEAC